MKSLVTIALLLGTGCLITASAGEDQSAGHECVSDAIGNQICPPPNGSIARDAIGNAVCGRGGCMKDAIGNWRCSSTPGGHAGHDAIGNVRCTGGCEAASPSICERLR